MFKKLKIKYKDSGIFGILIVIVRRSRLFRYFVVFYFYRVPLESLIKDVKKPSKVSIRIINSNEGLEEILKVQNKRDIFEARLNEGGLATLLYYDGVPVGYIWGQLSSPHYEERYGFVVEYQNTDVYYFDSYIDPKFRGLGLLKYLLNEFCRYAREGKGKDNMTAIIERQNTRSIKIHEGYGYRRINLRVAFKVFSSHFQIILRQYKSDL